MTWLQEFLLWLYRHLFPPRRARIALGQPYGDPMAAKKLVKSGAPVTMTDPEKEGAVLTVYDGAGLVVPPSTTWGVVWSSSDPTVLVVTPDATNPLNAIVSTPTPANAGTATISAVITTTPGGPALPAAVSPPITVTGSTPASADITLGIPQ